MLRKWALHVIHIHNTDYQRYTNIKTPKLVHNCNSLIPTIRQKSPILSYEMPTAFTTFTFFPKPPSKTGMRVKATMQKPFYHAFTTFTDTLQINAYSNRFHLPPEHITRHPVITRCSHINRLHTFADIFQFAFFQ